VVSTADPIPANPFPRNSPRHTEWRSATLMADEQHANLFASSATRPTNEFSARYASLFELFKVSLAEDEIEEFGIRFAAFEIWARRGLVGVRNDEELRAFDAWLVDYSTQHLTALSIYHADPDPACDGDGWPPGYRDRFADSFARGLSTWPKPRPRENRSEDYRNLFSSRVHFWRGRARATLREYEVSLGDSAPSELPSSRPDARIVEARAQRLAHYRAEHELGWKSFARHVGMSDTSIRAMIKGDRKRYAPERLTRLLEVLGITRDEWDSQTKKT
jgi:hypothetical protein